MMPSQLEVLIEQLVLHGVAPGDRQLIGAAVQQELTRLFAEQGVPRLLMQGGAIDRLDGGRLEVVAGAEPEGMGVQIAQAVYRGMNQ